MVQENQVGLKLNGTHQLLGNDDVNLLGDNIDTLIDASKKVGLEINIEKTKYRLLPHHQNVGQNQDIKIVNRSVTNQNFIQEEIKRRLNSGNACYRSVQNLWSSRLL
jgi:hypothetical protein